MSHIDDGKLNALLDGELDEADAAQVRAHIAACPECAKRFDEAKRFLAESAELLGALEPPAAATAAGPASASAAQPRRVTRTVKEPAIEVDEATQQSPAIRTQAVEPLLRRPPPPKRERRFDPNSLAWAAMVVLAIGVGYLANEVRHAREAQGSGAALAPASAAQRGAAPAESGAAGVPAAGRARDLGAPPSAAAGGRRGSGGPPAAKAPPGKGEPPVAGRASTGLGHKQFQPSARQVAGVAHQAPAPPSRALDAAAPTAAAPGAPGAAGSVAAEAPTPTPTPAEARNAAVTRRARPVVEGGADSIVTVTRDTLAADAAAPAGAFRTVTLEDAVSSLGGTIRLVDGLQIRRVQLGPGRLVAGADSTSDVVRVTYAAAGRALLLDQQRIEAAAFAAAAERAAEEPGAVVTVAPDGWRRTRWLDRDGFWLSLSGHVPDDTLRALAGRVR